MEKRKYQECPLSLECDLSNCTLSKEYWHCAIYCTIKAQAEREAEKRIQVSPPKVNDQF